MTNKRQHGGRRPGAGRPPLPGGAQRLSVVLPKPMVRWLDRQPGRNRSEKLRRQLLQHIFDGRHSMPVVAGRHVLIDGVELADADGEAVNQAGQPLGMTWRQAAEGGALLLLDDRGGLYAVKPKRREA